MKKVYERVIINVLVVENRDVLVNSDVFLYDNVEQDVFV